MVKFLTWKILKAVNPPPRKKKIQQAAFNNNPSGADQTRDVVGLGGYSDNSDTRSKPIHWNLDLTRVNSDLTNLYLTKSSI